MKKNLRSIIVKAFKAQAFATENVETRINLNVNNRVIASILFDSFFPVFSIRDFKAIENHVVYTLQDAAKIAAKIAENHDYEIEIFVDNCRVRSIDDYLTAAENEF